MRRKRTSSQSRAGSNRAAGSSKSNRKPQPEPQEPERGSPEDFLFGLVGGIIEGVADLGASIIDFAEAHPRLTGMLLERALR